MNGTMGFTEALQNRLDIIRPTQELVHQIAADPLSLSLSDGVKELIDLLHKQGKQVYVISGGFEELILPTTRILNIPEGRVFANRLTFDAEGRYLSFEDRATSRSGGKLDVLRLIKKEGGAIIHIGDGATDLEAKPEVDLFIGFGGNVVRDVVRQQADCFVESFATLLSALYD